MINIVFCILCACLAVVLVVMWTAIVFRGERMKPATTLKVILLLDWLGYAIVQFAKDYNTDVFIQRGEVTGGTTKTLTLNPRGEHGSLVGETRSEDL